MIDFTAIGDEGRHWVYEATVAPKLWHASRRADFRIWQNMTVPDILYRVLGENAIRFDMRLKASYRHWEVGDGTQYAANTLERLQRTQETVRLAGRVRVSHPWAGSNFGAIHIPRVGSEVIVDFLRGDGDRPIITGRVYNAEQMPPWGLPANKTQSGILTRSSPGGAAGPGLRNGPGDANALRFEDKAGEKQVWLHAQKDYLTEVENDESKWVGRDLQKEIDRDEVTEVHRHRTETVDGNETITVHMSRAERVDANETISIGVNRSEDVGVDEAVSIGNNQSLSVGKNRSKSVSANEKDSIGKNWSVKVGKMKTETVGLVSMFNVGLVHTENVGVLLSSNVGGQRIEATGFNKTETVGGDRSTTISQNDTLAVTDTLKVSAKRIELTGEEEIVLSCGTSTVRLTPQLLEILSTLVKINC